jgi:NADPH-dependent glutamate synthase beta subunit-like oxidoreductase
MDYGHAEVVAVFGQDPRQYRMITKEFRGENGRLKSLITQEAEVTPTGLVPVEGSEKEWPAGFIFLFFILNFYLSVFVDLVILAMGFVSPEQSIHSQLGLNLDQRNNIYAEYGDFQTNLDGVFSAGDCRRGQSLVVWAINEGRGVADKCNSFLLAKASALENEDGLFILQ